MPGVARSHSRREPEKTGSVNSLNRPRFFRCWSVRTRKDGLVFFHGNRAGLPPAQAGSDLLRSPRVITGRGNDARLWTNNTNGWRSVFSMTGG